MGDDMKQQTNQVSFEYSSFKTNEQAKAQGIYKQEIDLIVPRVQRLITFWKQSVEIYEM